MMAVYVIYDVGGKILIHEVSCPAGMYNCIIFTVLGNILVIIFPL